MTTDHILHDDPAEPIHICFTRCNGAAAYQEALSFARIVEARSGKPPLMKVTRKLDDDSGRFELLGHYYPMFAGAKAWVEALSEPKILDEIWKKVDEYSHMRRRL